MSGLPALLGALGLVAIIFALLSFLIALFGAPTGGASDLGWIGGNLLVGVALLVSAAAINFDALRERMSSGEAKRAGKYGTSAILTAIFGIAILALLAFLSTRYHWRFDWSEQGVHTLSLQSQRVLAGLEEDVEVLALVSSVEAQPLRELLNRYAYASERFNLEFADPNVRPGLLEQYGIAPDRLGRGLVRIAIGNESVEVDEITEENITNAMVKLTRSGEKVVYFVEGHGERSFEGEAGGQRDGFALAAEALRNENYRVEKLLLAAQGQVPEDADVVVLAAPRRPLLDVEHELLDRYLARGGAVLVLADPQAPDDLVERMGEWGIELADDVIVDRTLALFGRAMTPFAGSYDPVHEITRDLREPTLFHEARSVSGRVGADAEFTEIVLTSDSSWAERDLQMLYREGKVSPGEDDLMGPVPLAVAGRPAIVSGNGDGPEAAGDEDEEEAEEEPSEPRVVVFGDADFASNEFIESYRNRDLFVNSVNWLIGDVEAISIRPNRSRASRFQLTNEQFHSIRSLSLFVLPEAIAVIGVFVWWTRRHPTR